MRTLCSTSAFELFDRLDQQLQQHRTCSEAIPAAELRDLGDAYELLVELPGIERGSLQVNATDRSVTIEAQRPAPGQAVNADDSLGAATMLVSEFRYGPFRRSVRFPGTIDREQLQASYRDGLLRVRAVKANTRTSVPISILEG